MHYPSISITEDMLHAAREWAPKVAMRRTKASPIDAMAGVLGELVFAQYLFGDWRQHQLGRNKGKADFDTIEVKTSAFRFSTRLHLLVREDYALRRKPMCYVQIVIDIAPSNSEIAVGTSAVLCGYATSTEVDAAPLKDFGSKLGGQGGYRCHYIPIGKLHPMTELKLI